MQSETIYLAKSNRTNPDITAVIRNELISLGFVVSEFSGGNYTHEQMLKCSILIIIPHELKFGKGLNNLPFVGKGQYNQIQEYNIKRNGNDIFIVSHISQSGDISLMQLDDYYIHDVLDWTTKHGRVELRENSEILLEDAWFFTVDEINNATKTDTMNNRTKSQYESYKMDNERFGSLEAAIMEGDDEEVMKITESRPEPQHTTASSTHTYKPRRACIKLVRRK